MQARCFLFACCDPKSTRIYFERLNSEVGKDICELGEHCALFL